MVGNLHKQIKNISLAKKNSNKTQNERGIKNDTRSCCVLTSFLQNVARLNA